MEQESDCGAAEDHSKCVQQGSISWRSALHAGMIELRLRLRLQLGAFACRRCFLCSPPAYCHATPCQESLKHFPARTSAVDREDSYTL